MDAARRLSIWCLGTLVWIGARADAVYATTGSVPEIDPTTLSAGLALATGAVIILRSRMRRK
jgi:hypothetical protein